MADNDCRSQLIAAATPLFAEKGFKGVGVRELAAAAGVNISMISYYFKGKEGLYAAVLEEQFSKLKEVAGLRDREDEPMARFELYVRATVARYRKNPYLLRFYTGELTNPTPCFESIVKPAIREVLLLLQDTFREGVDRKRFRSELSAIDSALALAGMINFYFLLEPATTEMVDHAPARDEELVRHIMDLLARGILA